MDFLLNVLWVVLGGGWLICLEYLAAGVLLCLTIVGIPFGLQCFKLAKLGLVPFGHDFDEVPGTGVGSFALNVLWLLVAGISDLPQPPGAGGGVGPHHHRHPVRLPASEVRDARPGPVRQAARALSRPCQRQARQVPMAMNSIAIAPAAGAWSAKVHPSVYKVA